MATQIIEFRDPNCLVIGIHGPWGSGKSTFIRFLESEINDKHKDIVFVHFNPWNFSTIGQLIAMFFSEIQRSIGVKDKSGDIKNLGELLENFGRFLTPIQVVPGAAVIPNTIKSYGELLKKFGIRDLSDLKSKINALLKEYGKKVIIFVDDIDRLDKDSMLSMFRLIRLNADFINTIYILSFDRQVAIELLESEQKKFGRKYLEKIIQVPFDLPMPEKSLVMDFLIRKLNSLLLNLPKREWDEYRWYRIYYGGFDKFFDTIRDAKRFINALQLTLPIIGVEINYMDFIALESIRIFSPDVYIDLSKKKDFLTGRDQQLRDRTPKKIDVYKEELDKMFKKTDADYFDAVKVICKYLFPEIEGVYENRNYDESYFKIWRTEKRICSPDIFDKYFLLGTPKGEISDSEIHLAIEKTNDKKAFAQVLMAFKNREIIKKFLTRLDDFMEKIPKENIETIIEALLDIGDDLPREGSKLFDPSAQRRISWVIHDLLKQINESSERGQILNNVMNTGNGLYTTVHTFSIIESSIKKDGSLLINDNDLDNAKKIVLERIGVSAINGNLENVTGLGELLFRWSDLSDIEEPKRFVARLISTDDGIIKLISAFLSEHHTNRGNYFTFDKKAIEEMSQFTNPIELLPKVEKIKKSKMIASQEKIKAVDEFLAYFERESHDIFKYRNFPAREAVRAMQARPRAAGPTRAGGHTLRARYQSQKVAHKNPKLAGEGVGDQKMLNNVDDLNGKD